MHLYYSQMLSYKSNNNISVWSHVDLLLLFMKLVIVEDKRASVDPKCTSPFMSQIYLVRGQSVYILLSRSAHFGRRGWGREPERGISRWTDRSAMLNLSDTHARSFTKHVRSRTANAGWEAHGHPPRHCWGEDTSIELWWKLQTRTHRHMHKHIIFIRGLLWVSLPSCSQNDCYFRWHNIIIWACLLQLEFTWPGSC